MCSKWILGTVMIKTKGNLFNTDERNFNGLGSTQWKFKDFSATQILHEIIFWQIYSCVHRLGLATKQTQGKLVSRKMLSVANG